MPRRASRRDPASPADGDRSASCCLPRSAMRSPRSSTRRGVRRRLVVRLRDTRVRSRSWNVADTLGSSDDRIEPSHERCPVPHIDPQREVEPVLRPGSMISTDTSWLPIWRTSDARGSPRRLGPSCRRCTAGTVAVTPVPWRPTNGNAPTAEQMWGFAHVSNRRYASQRPEAEKHPQDLMRPPKAARVRNRPPASSNVHATSISTAGYVAGYVETNRTRDRPLTRAFVLWS